jgi:tryptophan synthase alpha chain
LGRIEETFARLVKSRRKAFMPFITCCDPSGEATVEIVTALEGAGADIIELGAAYSDPLADGPVIQDSYNRVLASGCRLTDYFATVRKIREVSQIPIAAMVSYSIVSKRGNEPFVRDAAEAGVDALIVPDLPPEESGDLVDCAREAGLGVVFLAAPTTPDDRLEKIAAAAEPFIYYVSVVGTTGARDRLPEDLSEGVKALKATTEKPVVVGFGVSNAATAAEVARIADGVIVGSALVAVIAENRGEPPAAIGEAVGKFAGPLAEAVKAAGDQ